MNEIPPLSENEFGLFQNLLIKASGLYFDLDRSQNLRFGLWERMGIKGYQSYMDYYNFLKFQPEGRIEMLELLDIITTGETYFFRYQSQFEVLMQVALPEIIARKTRAGDKSIRIWSAGCSRGDETYSIAIALMEALSGQENWELSILGTDINRNALICAKEAIYEKRDLGHSYKNYIAKYFKESKFGYVLNEVVKKIPKFEYHNLAKDPFTLDGMTNLDLIFCRNVTIYFDPSVTRDVINRFYECLTVGGFLFLGHAETIWYINNKFQTLEFPQTFVYKKPSPIAPIEAPTPAIIIPPVKLGGLFSSLNKDVSPPAAIPSKKTDSDIELDNFYSTIRELSQNGQYAAALLVIDKITHQEQNQNDLQLCFVKANILANLSRYDDAIDALNKIINQDNLFIEAYYLMGILLAKTGRWQDSLEQFRKVIYIDPNIAIVYFNLGNIYLSKKNFAKAALEFTNAIKILEKIDQNTKIKFCEEYTADFLLRVCAANLKEMTLWGGGETAIRSN